MGGTCRCDPAERQRITTVPWQADLCRTCGGDIPADETASDAPTEDVQR